MVVRPIVVAFTSVLAVILLAGAQTACASDECDARVFVCQGNHIADCISGDFGGRYYGEQVAECSDTTHCVESHFDAFCAISTAPDPRCKGTEDQKAATLCADAVAVTCRYGYAVAEEHCPATCSVVGGTATCN
jgi:hypothetical protein